MNTIKILEERGFVDNKTHDEELYSLFDQDRVTTYVGFDPTASSLHVGHLIPVMALMHFQRTGHRPIALVGGGTGLVGDPSGKTEMRKLLTEADIENNLQAIRKQLTQFLDFSDDNALCVNNHEWLGNLAYIPFLRDIGRYFSVNRMIKAESYKTRLDSEEGLTFIEFNYMILQAYDFKELFDRYGCRLQMGGSDQWGNIVAGIDLVRRMNNESVFGITFPLITTSSGAKMGKTEKGAVWLDAEKTSPYDYYQFWVNTDDRDIFRFLALFTFLPMAEINEASRTVSDSNINSIKSILAYEATRIVHGEEEAGKAHLSAMSMFGKRRIPDSLLPSSSIVRDGSDTGNSVPETVIEAEAIQEGMPAFKLFLACNLASSGSEARKLIDQGGGYLNGERIQNSLYSITEKDFSGGEIMLRAGKKKYHRVRL